MNNQIKKTQLFLTGIGFLYLFFNLGSLNREIYAQTENLDPKVTLKKIKSFDGFYKGSFSPDETRLSLIGRNKLKVVGIPSGKNVCNLDMPSATSFISAPFLPDGKTISLTYRTYDPSRKIGTQYIVFLDAGKCNIIKSFNSSETPYSSSYQSFSLDGRLTAAIVNSPRIWDVESGKEIYRLPLPGDYHSKETKLSPNGKWLASSAEEFVPPDMSHKFFITNLENKEIIELNSELIFDFRFSKDSTKLVTISSKADQPGGRIKIYETGSWKVLNDFPATKIGGGTDISPDASMIASGDSEVFKVISLQTGKTLAEAYHFKQTFINDLRDEPHLIGNIDYIEFSPDGKTLSTGGEDGTVKLWKVDIIR